MNLHILCFIIIKKIHLGSTIIVFQVAMNSILLFWLYIMLEVKGKFWKMIFLKK